MGAPVEDAEVEGQHQQHKNVKGNPEERLVQACPRCDR
jgi:hypothetical protein